MAMKPRYTEKQVIEAIQKARGMLAIAARDLKCARKTLIDYAAKSPEIEKALQEARELQKDVTEARLYQLIDKGELGAICFYLKTQARDRGYIEYSRVEHTGANGGPIETVDRTQLLTDLGTQLARLADAEAASENSGQPQHRPAAHA